MSTPDPEDIARAIIDANRFMTLGTVGGDGEPWVTPVFYASDDHRHFYWISAPDTRHSRHLAAQPRLSIVIFDSTVTPGSGEAVYMSGTARELSGADVDKALEVYPGPASRGGRPFAPAELKAPGPYRMYRASMNRHWILCPRETGKPCEPHGRAYDHRLAVEL